MNTGCPPVQEKATGHFGLSALLASVPGCAYTLLITASGLAC